MGDCDISFLRKHKPFILIAPWNCSPTSFLLSEKQKSENFLCHPWIDLPFVSLSTAMWCAFNVGFISARMYLRINLPFSRCVGPCSVRTPVTFLSSVIRWASKGHAWPDWASPKVGSGDLKLFFKEIGVFTLKGQNKLCKNAVYSCLSKNFMMWEFFLRWRDFFYCFECCFICGERVWWSKREDNGKCPVWTERLLLEFEAGVLTLTTCMKCKSGWRLRKK